MLKSAQSPMVSHFEAVFEKFEKCNFQYKIANAYFIGVCAGCDGRKVPRCRVFIFKKKIFSKKSPKVCHLTFIYFFPCCKVSSGGGLCVFSKCATKCATAVPQVRHRLATPILSAFARGALPLNAYFIAFLTSSKIANFTNFCNQRAYF